MLSRKNRSLILAISIGLTLIVAASHKLVQCQVAADLDSLGASQDQKQQPSSADTASEQANAEDSPKLKSYTPPKIKRDGVFLFDNFDNEQEFKTQWVNSKDPKYTGQWKLESGPDRPHADLQLLLPNKARHYAISSKLSEPFKFGDDKPLIVQYEVQFREGLDCGGAYVKLLRNSAIDDLTKLTDKTPYTIMFGPDKCGSEAKLHFISQYYNPKTQEYGEKHWKQTKYVNNLMSAFSDKKYHLFKLVLEPNNNFEIFMDGKSVGKGNLLEDVDPPINPPKNIVDPSDTKPEDWDERPKIEDPVATKPDDWDENAPKTIEDPNATKPSDWLENEPKHVPDPEAKKPEDWSDDMDGEWEAPKIDNPVCAQVSGCGEWKAPIIANPNYKGKWRPPMIENPNYKGKWEPRTIPNPDYFFDEKPFSSLDPIGAISFELWSMADNIAFDNLIITSNQESAELVQLLTWQDKKAEADATSPSLLTRATHYLKVYPWLWAIVVIAIALPLFLFISYCCETKKAPTDDASKRKKTDESKPDEPADDVEEVEEEEDDDEAVETGEEAAESEAEAEEAEEAKTKDQSAGDKASSKRPVRQRKN